MDKREDGGPAFPVEVDEHGNGLQTGPTCGWSTGISKRDYFAAAALTGLIGRRWENDQGQLPPNIFELWAASAYGAADAMLRESGRSPRGEGS